jgi:hypothetical protein
LKRAGRRFHFCGILIVSGKKNNKKARRHMARAFLSGPQDQVIT